MRFATRSVSRCLPLLLAAAVATTTSSGCGPYDFAQLRNADEVVHVVEKRMKKIEEDANNIHRTTRDTNTDTDTESTSNSNSDE